jgi:maleate isomerase
MIVPSSNTVVEQEAPKLLPDDGSVTLHFSRFRVVTISGEQGSRAQFELEAPLQAAALLADSRPDLILWNGTAASWLGFDYDDRLVAAIEARTLTRACTAVQAIDARLRRLGARSIALLTPYVETLETAIIGNYRAEGIETVAARRRDLTENTEFAGVAPAEIAAMARELAPHRPDAILIMCTNLAGAAIAPELEGKLGIPVLDSVRVAVEHSLELLAAR